MLFVLTVLLLCSPGTGGEPLPVKQTIASAPDTHNLAFVQNLTLEVSNTSPAVLDSTILFMARLRDYSGRLMEAAMYEYVWHDTEKPTNVTHGKFNSSLTRVYHSNRHRQGTYSMTVTVMRKKERVAVAAMDYHLTGHLNGNMTVKQNLSYQRQHDVLSTDRPILLRAKLHDSFPSSAQKLAYNWFINNQEVGISDQPELSLSLAVPGLKNVTVKVAAKVNSEVFLLPRYFNKSGQFSQYFTLKDPLDRLEIGGATTVNINTQFVVNITCRGSGPTSLCWQLFPLSGLPSNVTCSPTMFQAGCKYLVNLSIPTAGKYRLLAMLTNDVSRVEKQWYMYVYDPGSVNVPAITVPVVFALLAVTIIVGGAAYIMKLRKKAYVEVADFDFHPSLTRETENSRLSVRIRRTVQTLMSSPCDRTVPRPMKSTFTDYGSVEEDGAL